MRTEDIDASIENLDDTSFTKKGDRAANMGQRQAEALSNFALGQWHAHRDVAYMCLPLQPSIEIEQQERNLFSRVAMAEDGHPFVRSVIFPGLMPKEPEGNIGLLGRQTKDLCMTERSNTHLRSGLYRPRPRAINEATHTNHVAR